MHSIDHHCRLHLHLLLGLGTNHLLPITLLHSSPIKVSSQMESPFQKGLNGDWETKFGKLGPDAVLLPASAAVSR